MRPGSYSRIEVWLRVLSGEQTRVVQERFEQALTEMTDLCAAAANDEERRAGRIGLFTVYRYVIGCLRHWPGAIMLPRSRILLTPETALQACNEFLADLRSAGDLDQASLGALESRLEQTSGNVALALGHAQEALGRYDRAAALLQQHSPHDDEHLSIAKCKQAQAHLTIAEMSFDPAWYRGAQRFSSAYRAARGKADRHIAQSIGLLESAQAHAMRAGWAEGEPRISELTSRAFHLDDRSDLALLFAERSLDGYRKLGNQQHIGRLDATVERLRSVREGTIARRSQCDVLIVGRMRESLDMERVLSIKRLCDSLTIDGRRLMAQRVDLLVDSAGGRITDALIDAVWGVELVIAILDGLSPNVLYEIGLAHGRQKSVVLCLGAGVNGAETVPFDLKDYQVLSFGSADDLSVLLLRPLISELEALGHKVDQQ